jgi:hypothetical protein
MKKLIWLDVGTHFGQEHSSIFGSNISFFRYVIRRFLGGKVLKRGKFVSFNGLKNIIHARCKIRKRAKEFYTVFIEANPKIAYKKNFYPNADMVFNLALTNNSHTPVSITKLYLGNGDELSQGSSVFLEKHNVHKDSYVATLGVSISDFFSELEIYLSEKFDDYDILLRLNCEGVEDDVIYSVYKNFGSKTKLICGSLKDVKGVKGLDAHQKLEKFIKDNMLPFVFFCPLIYSWPEAHTAIMNLLDKREAEIN